MSLSHGERQKDAARRNAAFVPGKHCAISQTFIKDSQPELDSPQEEKMLYSFSEHSQKAQFPTHEMVALCCLLLHDFIICANHPSLTGRLQIESL